MSIEYKFPPLFEKAKNKECRLVGSKVDYEMYDFDAPPECNLCGQPYYWNERESCWEHISSEDYKRRTF